MSDGERASSFRLFAQRISLIWITNMLIAFSGIIILPIVTKRLTLDEYGSWNLVTLTLSVASIVAMLSLNTAIYRFFPAATTERRRDLIWSIAVIVFAISILMSLGVLALYLAGVGSSFLVSWDVTLLIMVTIPIYCLFYILTSYYIAMKKLQLYSVLFLAQAYIELALFVFFVQYGIRGLITAMLLVRGVLLLFVLAHIVRDLGLALPRFTGFREVFRYNMPLFSTKLTSWMVESSDRYIIDLFLTQRAVGLYAPGYSLGTTMYMIVSPVESVLTVTLTDLYEKGRLDEMKQYIEYSLKYIILLAVPAFFGLSVLSLQVLLYLTTDEIASVSYQITVFTAFSTLLLSLTVVSSQILLVYKETRVIGLAWMGAAVFNVLLNFLMVPAFGIIGAAITTLGAYALIFGAITVIAYRRFPFRVDWLFCIKSFAAAAVMAGAIVLFNPQSLPAVLISIPAGAALYLGIVFALRGFSKDEIRFIRGILHI